MSPAILLIRRYQAAFRRPPVWAFPLEPTIPFLGRNYDAGPLRIAVYASSENLSYYVRGQKKIPPFLRDERVWNRHRAAFESDRSDEHFRKVHIGPVNNGSLLCAVLFVRRMLGVRSPATPAKLLEEMVVGNVGKFSVKGNRNRDYAGNRRMLKESYPYFQLDLEFLSPDLLILPKTMLRDPGLQEIVQGSAPGCRVLPVPQFNPRVVNIALARHRRRAAQIASELAGTQIARWTSWLRGYGAGYPYRYYAEIERIIEEHRLKERPLRPRRTRTQVLSPGD